MQEKQERREEKLSYWPNSRGAPESTSFKIGSQSLPTSFPASHNKHVLHWTGTDVHKANPCPGVHFSPILNKLLVFAAIIFKRGGVQYLPYLESASTLSGGVYTKFTMHLHTCNYILRFILMTNVI